MAVRANVDVIEHVRTALHWARIAAEDAIFRPADTPKPPHMSGDLATAEKIVAETAMLCRAACAIPEFANDVAGIVGNFASHGRGIRLHSRMCADPASALVDATAHILFADLGSPDAASHGMLTLCLAQHDRSGTEMLPFQQLERLWLEPVATGRPADMAAIATIFESSCVGRPIDCLTATPLDLYQITHAVLFATDMGRRSIDLPRERSAFFADIEAALAVALDAENYDLVAELLWLWPMLGEQWSAIALFAFQLIDALCHQLGFLPGPDYRHADEDGLSLTERQQYRARTSYHTTLAMGILCAAILRSPASPEAERIACQPDLDAHTLIAQLSGSTTPRHWLARVGKSQSRIDRALGPLLITAYLRRAVATNDFAAIAFGLEFAVAHELTGCPAVEFARRLIERAGLLSRLIAG